MLEEPSDSIARDLTPSEVARLVEGDPEAAGILDRVYRPALQRFCWGYLGNMEEAEDAVQDVWHKVLQADSVPDRFKPWLYKIARNHCCNLLRERARRKEGAELPAASQVDAALTGHLTRLVKGEVNSQLAAAVSGLTDRQREVLRLRYVEDLARAEIAEVLDVPESVVKSRLFESMKRLREQVAMLEDS